MRNVTLGWFEIPVSDMSRAINFYEQLFDIQLEIQDLGGLKMAWFPFDHEGAGAGGSLVYHAEFYTPSSQGTLVYFNCEDVNIELARVEKAGGKIVLPKREIAPDIGFMAVFTDSEGNRIALHSQK